MEMFLVLVCGGFFWGCLLLAGRRVGQSRADALIGETYLVASGVTILHRTGEE